LSSYKEIIRRYGDFGSSEAEAADHPYDHNSDNRRSYTNNPHAFARRLRGFVHGPFGRVGKCREQKALDRECETEGDNEINHDMSFIEGS
jgi:hypothetical protein